MPLSSITSALGIGSSTDLTTFKVIVDNKPIGDVISLAIDHRLNSVPKAYILIADGNVAEQTFENSASNALKPGAEITISLGYNSLEEVVFNGVLVSQNIKISKNGKTGLELVCKDKTFAMTMSDKSKCFSDISEKQLLDELTQDYDGVSLKVDALSTGELSSERHVTQIQHNCSDWDFLMSRVESGAMYARVNDGVINIGGIPKLSLPEYEVSFGIDIIDLDLELNAETQYSDYQAESWNDKNQELVTEKSSSITIPEHGSIKTKELGRISDEVFKLKHSGNIPKKKLKNWVKSRKVRAALTKIKGTVTVQGSSVARPNQFIKLNGLGKKFNGVCFVSGVSHQVRKGNWVTTLQIGVENEWFVDKNKASNVSEKIASGSISGLYTGIVKQVHEDPEKSLRILVNVPAIDHESDGSWMRLSSFDASPEKGFVNRPDVDDEVIVGFVNNDVNHGVVLGALYSKSNAGSELLAPVEENNLKGWVIKEDMYLLFDSAEDLVELSTSTGNIIRIDQEVISVVDQFKNEIILDENGISISTDKDLNLSAKGDVNLEAKNVNLKAKSSLNAEGNTTELKGNSATTIKGNPVNIN